MVNLPSVQGKRTVAPWQEAVRSLLTAYLWGPQIHRYIELVVADLPIVGGSILAHDHFQGGQYEFAMERAPIETSFTFPGFEDVAAGIVKRPMSVIRIRSAHPERLIDLADKILNARRG